MRPGPVVVRVANCASVSSPRHVAADIFRTALTKAGPDGQPVVVLASECADFDAERIAEALGWDAVQYGRHRGNVAMAGSVLAWRDARPLGRSRLTVGSAAGEGIRTRYVVTQRLRLPNGKRLRFHSGHTPPRRAIRGRLRWLARVRLWSGVLGADFNTRPDELRRRYWRKVRGIGVLALLIPRRIRASPAHGVDIGSDHEAVDVVLYPTRNRRRNR